MDPDRDLSDLLRGQVERPEVPPLLEGDDAGLARGPEHVVVAEACDRLRRPGLKVVGMDVQGQVAVRDEIDPVLVPDGVLVGPGEIRDLAGLVLLQVIDPDILGPASPVSLPGPEFPHEGRVSQGLAVRREGRGRALGDLEGLFQPALQVDEEVLAGPVAVGDAVGLEQDAAAVRRPVQDLMVESAPRGEEADVVIEGQLPGNASGRGHDVNLARA